MSKYLKYLTGVFSMALLVSVIGSSSALAGTNGPPTRDINVRVIAICAAPVGVEPHDGGDSEVCLCFGRFFNGFNATGLQPNGRCASHQTGPFCFIDTTVGPIFWKETVTNQTGPTTVVPGEVVPISVDCPPGKMVLSCEGAVLVGDTTEVAANVASNAFPIANGLACRHVARADREVGETGPPAPVPQTGQTTCWDPADTQIPIDTINCSDAAAEGEDGDILAGVEWPSPRFTDNSDGTITDNLTGVIWLENANCFGNRTWAQALTDTNTLNDPECSLSDGSVEGDWRLPNIRELYSLIDFENVNPALPTGHPFMNLQNNFYYSSTTVPGSANFAMGVNFSQGDVGLLTKTSIRIVPAVRDGS